MFPLTEITNKKKTECKQSEVGVRKSTAVRVFVTHEEAGWQHLPNFLFLWRLYLLKLQGLGFP